MNVSEVMSELEKLGSAQTRKTLSKHGLPETAFGVKIGDMKPLIKRIKTDHKLALELFDTLNADAQYLASYLIDDQQSTKKELQRWVETASWHMVGEYAVAWAAAESRFGWELSLKWIGSKKESIAASGWATLWQLISTRPDEELDLEMIKVLLDQVVEKIGKAPNRVRYTMNGFVICVGCFVKPLHKEALAAAKKIGVVEVDMKGTACKVPVATDYIKKVVDAGRLGKKRKNARC